MWDLHSAAFRGVDEHGAEQADLLDSERIAVDVDAVTDVVWVLRQRESPRAPIQTRGQTFTNKKMMDVKTSCKLPPMSQLRPRMKVPKPVSRVVSFASIATAKMMAA